MKYLGLDWGQKRVGLAISEGTLASPLKTIEVKNLSQVVETVRQVVEKEKVGKILIGLPEAGAARGLVLKAETALKEKGLEVETVDETLSSKQAIREMLVLGLSKKQRKNEHAHSAALILQGYLDDQ